MNHEEMLKIEGHVFYVSAPGVGFAFSENGNAYSTMSDRKNWTKIKEGDGILNSEEYINAVHAYTPYRNKDSVSTIQLVPATTYDCITEHKVIGNMGAAIQKLAHIDNLFKENGESESNWKLEKISDDGYGLICIDKNRVQLADGIDNYYDRYTDVYGRVYVNELECIEYWVLEKTKDIAYMEDSLGVNLSRKLWNQIHAESKLDQDAIDNLNLNDACLSDSDDNKAPWLQ